ncbi:MAG: CocE/NonD family hydrolase [Planctomycetes bacterium]|nr:CocE/NonD family hydrolase [Planctomycetota bacterium]
MSVTSQLCRRLAGLILLMTLTTGVSCQAQSAVQTQMVPMSDGIKLATDVYLPKQGEAPFPVILLRTPYNKLGNQKTADNVAKLGYALVVQDMRGRFASEGHHAIIFGNDGIGGEHQDGHDTLKWIAKQNWSNGNVITYGQSALGIAQNMAAPGAPAALKGQVVGVAFSDYYHQAAYQGGVWRKELLEGWLKQTKMDDVNLPTFLQHSTYDDFWKGLNAEAHADQVDAPGVFTGGWYDIFIQGTINSFVEINRRGGPNARDKCFLLIAPTAHGKFDEAVIYRDLAKAPVNLVAPMNILDCWVGKPNSAAVPLKPVHYYVMGDCVAAGAPGNFWRSADDWPPPAKATPFYLQADHSLSAKATSGDDTLTYKYDPQNPVPTRGGQNLLIAKGPMDQRPVESRPDVLLFTSEPLSGPIEVTGRITAKLFVSSDCPDTDFTVKLSDVYPDGKSMLVTDGIRRASLRNSYEKHEPLEAGQVYELEVDLWSTSLIFNKGHQIRIAVSSSNSPRFEPNPNTGDPHLVPGKMRIANNTLHLSDKYPSHIVLPVYNDPGTE